MSSNSVIGEPSILYTGITKTMEPPACNIYFQFGKIQQLWPVILGRTVWEPTEAPPSRTSQPMNEKLKYFLRKTKTKD